MEIKTISEKEVVEFIKTSRVVVLDFFATWCEPCKRQHKILEEILSEFAGKSVSIAQIDVDENRDISDSLCIEAVPTLLVFVDGKRLVVEDKAKGVRVDSFRGTQKKEMLSNLIASLLEEPVGSAEPSSKTVAAPSPPVKQKGDGKKKK